MSELKEKIADLIGDAMIVQCPEISCIRAEVKAIEARDNAANQIHKEYMAWFQEEIEKLKPLSGEEVMTIRRLCGGMYKREFDLIQAGTQAAVDDIKRQLKEMME